MLPTHEHVASYRGYEIYLRRPGFEFTPMMLGKIASFLVRGPDRSLAVFAFMYSMLAALDGEQVEEDRLLDQAVQAIRVAIDDGDFADRREFTFEYRDGRYGSVVDPAWWIRTFGRSPTGNG